MFCPDCFHPLINDGEKALNGEIQLVRRSTLSQSWVCEVTGNEHREGSALDFQDHVRTSLPRIFEFVEGPSPPSRPSR